MSNKLKIILFTFLLIIIVLTLVGIYFLVFNQDSKNVTQEPTQNIIQNEIQVETDEENETNTENTISNTVQNITSVNLSNTTESNDSEEIDDTGVNINELKKLMESYAIGIHRISYSGENLESNTILLLLAKQYFDTNSNKKNSLKVDSKYATTVENMHKYLTELTGNNYNNIEYLSSYKNYIGYASSNRAYVYGKDISELKNEEYECPKLELTNEENGIYTAKGEVIRIKDNVETVYDISLKFQINENYTYQKYQIVSLKTANKSFYPDNTVHLVENTEVE
jgi:hypothetical protein